MSGHWWADTGRRGPAGRCVFLGRMGSWRSSSVRSNSGTCACLFRSCRMYTRCWTQFPRICPLRRACSLWPPDRLNICLLDILCSPTPWGFLLYLRTGPFGMIRTKHGLTPRTSLLDRCCTTRCHVRPGNCHRDILRTLSMMCGSPCCCTFHSDTDCKIRRHRCRRAAHRRTHCRSCSWLL